ncbi:hypothetical protein ALC56_06467 [Trachymyrmex septentrionalis]|uniref:Transmembrane protein 177 n=2 Tax=Trachymyrmex septentrionalis TaxID=34720 RepID=A0A195FFA2_9HYME|nr:hypothetical protein ALC56_06467 [Trachymyrmex septentrionalis]
MGTEVPLSSKVQQIIQKVMSDLKLSDDVKNAIKPVSVFGFDLLHAGTLNAKYGAILGIPINFTSTVEQLHKNLQIKQEPVDWQREDAKAFLKAVTFSEDAQKFAIAREILRIQAEEPCFNSLSLALIIGTLWTLYNVIPIRYRLYNKKTVIIIRTFYTTFILFGAIFWFGVKDYRSYQLDKENDEALCRLGTEYIKGGQEFYEKMLSRNRALRTLLGTDGKSTYTIHGNEEYFLRMKHIPISYRKDFFDSNLRNLEGMK